MQCVENVKNQKARQKKYHVNVRLTWATAVRTKEQRHPWIPQHVLGTLDKPLCNAPNHMRHFHLLPHLIPNQTLGDRLQVMICIITTTPTSLSKTSTLIIYHILFFHKTEKHTLRYYLPVPSAAPNTSIPLIYRSAQTFLVEGTTPHLSWWSAWWKPRTRRISQVSNSVNW
jgi:hypothetical protein